MLMNLLQIRQNYPENREKSENAVTLRYNHKLVIILNLQKYL